MAKTCPVCGKSYEDSSIFCPSDGTTLRADEAAEDLVGSVIADRYKITKLLGEGGMGRVYLAEHVRLPQKAAIKVLHPGMVKDNDAVARFNREAANAAKIEHDRVARVFDFGETREGLVYLAMEFVPGRTIRALLTDEGTLTPTRAASLTYQIAEGLDAAHRIGIVHRDLKPDNIIVMTDDQGTDRSKVVDFGIAKAVGGNDTQLTRTGMVVGTPEFMSPEQVLGESLDARSDVYALALVSYQMLTGMLPFSSSTPERSLTARLIEDPRPLSVAVPEGNWPAEVQAAFDRALAREPDQRTATALEFAEALVAATESWTGTSVLRPRTPMSTSAITAAANAVRPTSATPSFGAAASSSGPAVRQGVNHGANAIAPAATARVEMPAARSKAPMLIGGALLAAAAIAAFVMNRDRSGSTAPNSPQAPVTTVSGTTVPPTAPATTDPTQTAARGGQSTAPIGPAASPGPGRNGGTPAAVPTSTAPVAPNPAAVGPVATDGNQAAGEARKLLAAIRKELDDVPEGSMALIGAEDANKLRGLLPDLTTRSDSAWAFVTLAIAQGYANRTELACAAFKTATLLASSPAQRDMVRNMIAVEPFVSCRP